MNADLEHLVVLQAQDLELKRLRQELADTPRRVTAAEAGRAKAEFALAAARQSLSREEALRRSQESDIATRGAQIARLGKQMETATSAAQISALEHEIHFAKEAVARLEDEELLSMERTDQQEAARLAGAAALESATTTLAATRSTAAHVAARNTTTIAGIEAERATLRATVSGSDSGAAALSTYDRIAKAKGTGLSEAVDQKCAACQMMVRPQRWNDLKGREHDHIIFTCETCGRMLFYDPRRDAPVRWTPGERLAGPRPASSAPAPSKISESA